MGRSRPAEPLPHELAAKSEGSDCPRRWCDGAVRHHQAPAQLSLPCCCGTQRSGTAPAAVCTSGGKRACCGSRWGARLRVARVSDRDATRADVVRGVPNTSEPCYSVVLSLRLLRAGCCCAAGGDGLSAITEGAPAAQLTLTAGEAPSIQLFRPRRAAAQALHCPRRETPMFRRSRQLSCRCGRWGKNAAL